MKSGCTRSTSHKVASTLSLVVLTVDLFVLNKLLHGLDCSYALIYDAISLFLKLAVSFLTIFTNRNQVFDESTSKQKTNHGLFANDPTNGILVQQIHAASCLLRLCTLLVSHKRRIACRCMNILSCLCSLIYIFARTHPLYHHLYKLTCAMNAPAPGDDRQIGVWEIVRRVKTAINYVCSHLLTYSMVSVVPTLCLTVQCKFSYDTIGMMWLLFVCDVIVSAAACGCLVPWYPVVYLQGKTGFISTSVLRIVVRLGFHYLRSKSDSLNTIELVFELVHWLATFLVFVAQTRLYIREMGLTPEQRKTLLQKLAPTSKERKPLSESQKYYALYVLVAAFGLAALGALLPKGKLADAAIGLYGAVTAIISVTCVWRKDYQIPAVSEEDVDFEEMPEDLKGASEIYKKTHNALVGGPVPWTAIYAAGGCLLLVKRFDGVIIFALVSSLLLICVSYWLIASPNEHKFEAPKDVESHPGTKTKASVQTTSAGSQTIVESSSTRVETELDANAETTTANVPPAREDASTSLLATMNDLLKKQEDASTALLATLNDLLKKQEARDARQEARDARQEARDARQEALNADLHDILKRQEARDADLHDILKRQEARDADLHDILKRQEARDADLHDILKRQDARDTSLHAILEPMTSYFRERITTTVADATSVETETAHAGTQSTVIDLATAVAEPECSDLVAKSTDHDMSITATESDTTGSGPRAAYPAEASAGGVSDDDNTWKKAQNRKKRSRQRC